MNKYIILLIAISLFSCEKKKPSATNQTQTTISEVSKTDDAVAVEIEKVEQIEETIDGVIKNSKEIKEPEPIQILPKSVLFGEIKVDVVEGNENIQITSNNEFAEKYEINLKGVIDTFIETDVDGNGFNEFYIVSTTGDLAAFSSYNNKSFGEINVAKKPYIFYEDCTKVKFWEAKNKKLSITFENSQGQLNTVRYKLAKGEASYQLVAE